VLLEHGHEQEKLNAYPSMRLIGAPLSVRNTMIVLLRILLSERADTIFPTDSSNLAVISVIKHMYVLLIISGF